QKKIVKIEFRRCGACTLQLDVAHGSLRRRAAGSEQGIHQRAQRTDRISTGAPHLTHYKDLHGAQLPKVDVEIEIAKDALQLRSQITRELLKLESGDVDVADLRNVDGAGAIDRQFQVEIQLAPHAQQNLVARAEHIIRRDRYAIHRCK